MISSDLEVQSPIVVIDHILGSFPHLRDSIFAYILLKSDGFPQFIGHLLTELF